MHHFFVKANQILGDGREKMVRLSGPDAHHARQVLRIRPGEELLISDGLGNDYLCAVHSLDDGEILARVLGMAEERELSSSLILYQSMIKGEKMEWMIQKAVELGVSRIVPVATKFTVVKFDQKKEESKRQRWQAIAESAAKQSKRSKIPEIGSVLTFEKAVGEASACDISLFAYEHEEGMDRTAREIERVKPGQRIAVFIGPEGGFSPEEAELACKYKSSPISLGKRILRAETAGIALLSVLMMKLECGSK